MNPVSRRQLGATDLRVSGLGMGCARLGAFWQGRSPRAARGALEEAHAAGINFFDTADCYARGLSERIIGQAFRDHRDDLVICTKVGMLKTPLAVALARHSEQGRSWRVADLKGMAPHACAQSCFAPRYIEAALDRSLRRLATDRVELLLLHGPPVEVIRAQAFLPAVQRLVAAGKVRHFGISCGTEEECRAALDVPGLRCLQTVHNLSRSDTLPSLVPEAQRRGIGLIAMAPFGDGNLLAAGASVGLPAEALASGCLGFALATPGVASVMVGMSTPEHVRSNIRAAALPALAPNKMAELTSAVTGELPPRC